MSRISIGCLTIVIVLSCVGHANSQSSANVQAPKKTDVRGFRTGMTVDEVKAHAKSLNLACEDTDGLWQLDCRDSTGSIKFFITPKDLGEPRKLTALGYFISRDHTLKDVIAHLSKSYGPPTSVDNVREQAIWKLGGTVVLKVSQGLLNLSDDSVEVEMRKNKPLKPLPKL